MIENQKRKEWSKEETEAVKKGSPSLFFFFFFFFRLKVKVISSYPNINTNKSPLSKFYPLFNIIMLHIFFPPHKKLNFIITFLFFALIIIIVIILVVLFIFKIVRIGRKFGRLHGVHMEFGMGPNNKKTIKDKFYFYFYFYGNFLGR